MRALTVEPGQKDSLSVSDVADPTPGDGELLVGFPLVTWRHRH
jgi:NADPH:quinone reductase-like Zn-dependent oxidoreductase